ncbi:unnamed protein product [Tilletia controversa]|nr:unnamed protein product [Tilletia controversa]
MPRAERNAIESALETLVPAPVVDVLSALGRFVYAAVFSRSIDPNSWTASLVPPLISLLLAYASLVIAYRTVRNTFSLALFGVKYGALIGALIAIYSWWSGDSDAAGGLAGIVGGALGGAGGVAGGVGGRDANAGGILAGGADILHALGRLGQGGGAAALPLLGALLGQVQNQGGRNNNNNNPRRSTRLRSQNSNRRRARPANSNAYSTSDPDYLLDDDDDDDDDDLDPVRGAGAGDDTAIKAVKQVLRWITHATDPEANANARRAAPPNPLFPQTGSRSNSNSRRRRRRRSSSGLSDLD